MTGEIGPFEAFYASDLQHPVLLWAAALLALLPVLLRRDLAPSLRRYGVALVGLSLLDAWLTSTHVAGIGTLRPPVAGGLQLFFVLAGDFRYLLLVTAARPDGRLVPAPRPLAVAAVLTLVVPVASQLVLSLLPDSADTPRVLFFVYETLFVVLTLLLLRLHPNLRPGSWLRLHPNLRPGSWLRGVSRFVIVYYALWATADAMLLATGSDWGFLLRVVPNVLYYGGLIAVVGVLAPRGPRAPEETR